MVSKPWQPASHPKQTGNKIMELENTVKEILNGAPATTPALVNSDSELLKEIAELKVKLAAALEQGALDSLKARQVEALTIERDELKQQLDTLTVAQPMPVAVTNNVECSIQYDVKAPDMHRRRNGACFPAVITRHGTEGERRLTLTI